MLWGNCEEIVYMDNDAIIVIAGFGHALLHSYPHY